MLGWRAGGPGPRELHGNFLQGARWSPDGACLLAAAADRRLRRFDLPAGAAGPSGRGPPFAAGLEVLNLLDRPVALPWQMAASGRELRANLAVRF